MKSRRSYPDNDRSSSAVAYNLNQKIVQDSNQPSFNSAIQAVVDNRSKGLIQRRLEGQGVVQLEPFPWGDEVSAEDHQDWLDDASGESAIIKASVWKQRKWQELGRVAPAYTPTHHGADPLEVQKQLFREALEKKRGEELRRTGAQAAAVSSTPQTGATSNQAASNPMAGVPVGRRQLERYAIFRSLQQAPNTKEGSDSDFL